ncbi:LysE family translocator [Streptomyces sp. ME19-01-6]|uniref:LysE family translocator n=1 Tax=Streptomyces sp. ME19-01-6 TaxID=3028686 RepID=UPI0029A65A37|nr:LysE family translocator [Streptomyces sp. ME19-01-6]MDX3232220.1 LysE family translocator [Streptomyces sp. ME19-01-6]
MDLSLIAAFVAAAFLLSVAPGPDMLFIVANATAGGRRAGLVAALGMSTGLAVHTLAAALGLSALFRAAPEALEVVRLAGAVFLIYLAVTSWRAGRDTPGGVDQDPEPATAPRRPLRKLYLMATLTNVANPKVILFYLAFLPQFLTVGDGAWPVWLQLLTLGGLFIMVGLPVDSTVGLAAGSLADKLLRRPSFRRRLERASAVVFGGLAVRLALDSR